MGIGICARAIFGATVKLDARAIAVAKIDDFRIVGFMIILPGVGIVWPPEFWSTKFSSAGLLFARARCLSRSFRNLFILVCIIDAIWDSAQRQFPSDQ